jgi:hypothetical protein
MSERRTGGDKGEKEEDGEDPHNIIPGVGGGGGAMFHNSRDKCRSISTRVERLPPEYREIK